MSAPLLDLGLVQGAECLRGLLLAWEKLLPEIGQARAHLRVGEAAGGEPDDDGDRSG